MSSCRPARAVPAREPKALRALRGHPRRRDISEAIAGCYRGYVDDLDDALREVRVAEVDAAGDAEALAALAQTHGALGRARAHAADLLIVK